MKIHKPKIEPAEVLVPFGISRSVQRFVHIVLHTVLRTGNRLERSSGSIFEIHTRLREYFLAR
jgi:uncharacterized protein with von Willebrand factor type A (vWA) domain